MNRGSTVLAVAVVLVLASLALAEELPQPFDVGGGWQSCPVGYLIYETQCLPSPGSSHRVRMRDPREAERRHRADLPLVADGMGRERR
jgi:hypothetical protein